MLHLRKLSGAATIRSDKKGIRPADLKISVVFAKNVGYKLQLHNYYTHIAFFLVHTLYHDKGLLWLLNIQNNL